MAAVLDLSNRSSRRLGMTRSQYRYTGSLLESGPQLKNEARTTTPDIFAPPQDSSDEASVGAGENSSENPKSAEERCRTGSRSPKGPTLEKASSTRSRNSQRELSVEPSTIPATCWNSSKNVRSSNGSPEKWGGEKNLEAEDEDDMSCVWSQPKRRKTMAYTGSSQRSTQDNIHHSSVTDQKRKPTKKETASQTEDGKPSLRFLKGTDSAIARVSKLYERDTAAFKKPPSAEPIPRRTTTRARASQGSQNSSRGSQRPSFKVLKQPSPKQNTSLEIKAPQVSSGNARATRSRKPPIIADIKDLPFQPSDDDSIEQAKEQFSLSHKVQYATDMAKEKLGLSVETYKPPISPKTTSSLPSTYFDDISSNSPLSSPPPETPDTSPTQKNIDYVNNAALGLARTYLSRCPFCREEVDKAFFDECVGPERLTVRQQEIFCKAHKKYTAEAIWEKQGFPKIDWHQLDERLRNYHNDIDDILQGQRFSFYRNAFEDLVKNRKDRTIHKSLMNGHEIEEMTPGYYGSRGARIMVENIMARFASKLRRLAATDKLISSGGVTSYVQAVLVPELAVLLVMDDLGVDPERAREVLRESIDVGNLLNEEEDEHIRDPVGDVKALLESA